MNSMEEQQKMMLREIFGAKHYFLSVRLNNTGP